MLKIYGTNAVSLIALPGDTPEAFAKAADTLSTPEGVEAELARIEKRSAPAADQSVMEEHLRDRAKARRAALAQAIQAKHKHGSSLHPDAQAVLQQPFEDFMADDDDKFDKLLKGVTNMPTPDKNAVAGMLDDYATAQRQPGETVAKSYLRLVKTDCFAKSLYHTHQTLQHRALADRLVAKSASPEDSSAYKALCALGETIRKREPKFTQAQAFTKAYCDPANRRLVEICKREQRGLPLDAA